MAVTVTLNDEAEAFARSCVEDGLASSIEEAVHLAFKQIEAQREPGYHARVAAFESHIMEGIEQADHGEFVPMPTVEELMEEAKRRRRAREHAAG